MPFRTKICGVTSSENAIAVAASGVDAIGLNFFAGSPRCINLETAVEIATQLPQSILKVGVFVNASIDAILETHQRAGLDLIQLHGDEPAEFLDQLAGLRVIRAFRCQGGLGSVEQYLQRCRRSPEAVLIDAHDPQAYGGTGKTANWEDVGRRTDPPFQGLPLILAGGLSPDNVARAIQVARPHGVDVASGVEKKQPGRKDPLLCQQFVSAARTAFSS